MKNGHRRRMGSFYDARFRFKATPHISLVPRQGFPTYPLLVVRITSCFSSSYGWILRWSNLCLRSSSSQQSPMLNCPSSSTSLPWPVSVPSRSPVSKSSSSQPSSACPGKSGGVASADGALWSFQAVLSRLQKMGIKVFRTDRDGEIVSVKVKGVFTVPHLICVCPTGGNFKRPHRQKWQNADHKHPFQQPGKKTKISLPGLPSFGPDMRIPCSSQNFRFSLVLYIWSTRIRFG